jgi:hypothetical protein
MQETFLEVAAEMVVSSEAGVAIMDAAHAIKL